MEKWRIFLFQKEFECRCWLNSSFGFIEIIGEDLNIKDMVKNIQSWEDCDNFSCSNVDYLFGVKDNENFIFDNIFVVFDIENYIFEIDNDDFFLNEFFFSYSDWNFSYLINVFMSEDFYYNCYMYDV